MENQITQAAQAICAAFQKGGKLLLCGNGGSAADCAHITGELVKGFLKKRPLAEDLKARIGTPWAEKLQGGLPALDLTANSALIAAVINDLDGLNAYAQQVMAYGQPGDVLLGISTSGNSENVCRAMIAARAMGLTVIALTGKTGGKMRALCDLWLSVDETETYRVQEKHLPLYHQLCIQIEASMFPENKG